VQVGCCAAGQGSRDFGWAGVEKGWELQVWYCARGQGSHKLGCEGVERGRERGRGTEFVSVL